MGIFRVRNCWGSTANVVRSGAMVGARSMQRWTMCLTYSPYVLYQYHTLIMDEMERRGYNVTPQWKEASYRGKICPPYTEVEACEWKRPLYKEHDDAYYKECIENLAQKGIILEGENHV